MGDKVNKAKKAVEAIYDERIKNCKIIITKDKNGKIRETFIQKKESL